MADTKTDRRVKRTRQNLRRALVQLLLERDLSAINVTEVCRHAGVNRGTFYLHYKSVSELYEKTENAIVEEFDTALRRTLVAPTRELLPVIATAFDFLSNNAADCSALLRTNDEVFLSRLLERAREIGETGAIASLITDTGVPAAYYFEFVSSGCVGLMRKWLKSGMRETPLEMSTIAASMVARCANVVMPRKPAP